MGVEKCGFLEECGRRKPRPLRRTLLCHDNDGVNALWCRVAAPKSGAGPDFSPVTPGFGVAICGSPRPPLLPPLCVHASRGPSKQPSIRGMTSGRSHFWNVFEAENRKTKSDSVAPTFGVKGDPKSWTRMAWPQKLGSRVTPNVGVTQEWGQAVTPTFGPCSCGPNFWGHKLKAVVIGYVAPMLCGPNFWGQT